jgi:hypothetical protein
MDTPVALIWWFVTIAEVYAIVILSMLICRLIGRFLDNLFD